MARSDPQVNIRLPSKLIEALEMAAQENNRSFKGEIEYRLTGWDEVQEELRLTRAVLEEFRLSQAAEDHISREETKRREAEIEALRTALEQAKQDAAVTHLLQKDMAQLVRMVNEVHVQDRAVLDEVRELEMFLRSDAICIQAVLDREHIVPSAVRPAITTELAQSLAQTIDARSWWLIQSVLELASSAREHKDAAVLAQHHRHKVQSDDGSDFITQMYLDEVDGLATPLDAAAFYESALKKIEGFRSDTQQAYRDALDRHMPKLFKGWAERWM